MKTFVLRTVVWLVAAVVGLQSLSISLQAQEPALPEPPPLVDLVTRTLLFYPAFLTQEENLALLQAFLDTVAAGEPDPVKAQLFIVQMQNEITGDLIYNSPLTGEIILDSLDRNYGSDFNALFGPMEDFVGRLPEVIGSASPEEVAGAFVEFASFVATQAPETMKGWINSYPGFTDDLQALLARQVGLTQPSEITMSLSLLADGSVKISFSSQTNATYRIQSRDSFSSGAWQDSASGEVTASNSSTEYVDNTAAGKPMRFYRVSVVRESTGYTTPALSDVSAPLYRTLYPAETIQYVQDQFATLEPYLLAFPSAEDKPGALVVILEVLRNTAASVLSQAPPTSELWASVAPAGAVTALVAGPIDELVIHGGLLAKLQEAPDEVPGLLVDYINYLSEQGPLALTKFIEEAPSIVKALQTYVSDRAPGFVPVPPVDLPADPADVIGQIPNPADLLPEELPVPDPAAEVEKVIEELPADPADVIGLIPNPADVLPEELPMPDPAAEVEKVIEELPADPADVIGLIPNPADLLPEEVPMPDPAAEVEKVVEELPAADPAALQEVIDGLPVPDPADLEQAIDGLPVPDPAAEVEKVIEGLPPVDPNALPVNPEDILAELPDTQEVLDTVPTPEDVIDLLPAEVPNPNDPIKGPELPYVDPTPVIDLIPDPTEVTDTIPSPEQIPVPNPEEIPAQVEETLPDGPAVPSPEEIDPREVIPSPTLEEMIEELIRSLER